MTDVGTETAFRLDQRKHFRKNKHLLRSEVSCCDQTGIDLHLHRSTPGGHFSLVRTTLVNEKILYYRELLVSEKRFKKCWIPLVLPTPVVLGKIIFYYRELLVSENFLYVSLWFYCLRRVSGLVWAKKSKNSLFQVHSLVQDLFNENWPIARC